MIRSMYIYWLAIMYPLCSTLVSFVQRIYFFPTLPTIHLKSQCYSPICLDKLYTNHPSLHLRQEACSDKHLGFFLYFFFSSWCFFFLPIIKLFSTDLFFLPKHYLWLSNGSISTYVLLFQKYRDAVVLVMFLIVIT